MSIGRTSAGVVLALAVLAGCQSIGVGRSEPGVGPAGAEAPVIASVALDEPVHLLDARKDAKAAPRATTQPGGAAVTPEMLAALRQLSAEDFATRQEAVKKLQHAMAKHFEQMVLVQELMLKIQDSLAAQLREMTMQPEGEAQARVASLMEFNNALSRWAIDVLALPEAQRQKLLNWGLDEDNIVLVAKAYARQDDVRAAAAKELAKQKGEAATWMLCQLLMDTSREVSLTAMDAVYEREPEDAVIEALWTRATAYTYNQLQQRQTRYKTITVRGRTIQVYDQDYAANQRMQDADVATDVLIKYKQDSIRKRLDGLFVEMESTLVANPNDYRWRSILSPNYGSNAMTFSRLVEEYRPKKALAFVVKALQSNYQDGYNTNVNNKQYRQSTRVDMAALFALLTNQDPGDYNLEKVANYNNRWMVLGQEKEEEESVRKLLKWWKEHHKEFGVEDPGKLPADLDKPVKADGKDSNQGDPQAPAAAAVAEDAPVIVKPVRVRPK